MAPLRLLQPKSRPLPPLWCGLSLPLATASPPPAARTALPARRKRPQLSPSAAQTDVVPRELGGGRGRKPGHSREAGQSGAGRPCAVWRSLVSPACRQLLPLPVRSHHVLRPRPPCRRRSPPQLQHLGPGRPDEGLPAGGGPPVGATWVLDSRAALIPGPALDRRVVRYRPGPSGALGRPGYWEGSAERKPRSGRGGKPPGPPESLHLVCTASRLRSFGCRAENNLRLYAAFHSTLSDFVLVASVQTTCNY